MCLGSLLCVPSFASAATIFVNPGDSIQDAIDDADPGDTVVIRNGFYDEDNITIDKDLTVRGQSKNGVIIFSDASYALSVTGDDVSIQSLTCTSDFDGGIVSEASVFL